MDNKFKFRLATAADIDAINKIYQHVHDEEEAGRTTTGWVRSIYPTRVTAEEAVKRGDIYVCELGSRIVASGIINKVQLDEYADAEWLYKAKDDEVSVLHTLAVEPEAMHKGIGTAFIDFYTKTAKSQGCKVLRIDTGETNTVARKLYARLGFRDAGIIPTLFNNIEDVNLVLLEKLID